MAAFPEASDLAGFQSVIQAGCDGAHGCASGENQGTAEIKLLGRR